MVDFDKDIFTETIVLSFEEYNKNVLYLARLQSIDKQSPFGLTPWAFFCLYLFQLFDYLCSRMTKKVQLLLFLSTYSQLSMEMLLGTRVGAWQTSS